MIKSDEGIVASISSAMKTKKNQLSQKDINSSTKSNIEAVKKSKTVFKSKTEVINKYENLLSGDITKVSTLGKEFTDFDYRMSKNMA